MNRTSALVDNLKSRAVAFLAGMFAAAHERRAELAARPLPASAHVCRWFVVSNRANGKRGSFWGPVGVHSADYHWVSRQTCRAMLRAQRFAWASRSEPLMSRRDRRRLARVTAGLDYRVLMADDTNVVANERELLQQAGAA